MRYAFYLTIETVVLLVHFVFNIQDITRDEYVVGVPTFVLYKNGQRLDVTSNESKLKEMISQHK